MLNYRLVAVLILIACVVSPFAISWVNQPDGSWLRPYVVWLLAILACFIWQRPPRLPEPPPTEPIDRNE